MHDKLWEIFGYIIIAVSLVLAGWEIAVFRSPEREEWLVTPRRLRRRLLVSFVLIMIGALVLVEAVGIISIQRLGVLIAYVVTVSVLALVLLLLAAVDAGDTMRNASKHAMDELDRSIEEEKQRNEALNRKQGSDST